MSLALQRQKRAFGIAAALLTLVLLNPLTFSGNTVAGGLFPDSLAYIQMGREIIEHGKLFLAGWGHVDSGIVLPPLYPALVGLVAHLGGDGIVASYEVSACALGLAVLPWFFLALRSGNTWWATFAVAAVQLNAAYLTYATASLTEGLFIFGLSVLALWSGPALERSRPLELAALGAAAGLLFLTRQVGLFIVPALTLLVLLQVSSAEGQRIRLAAVRLTALGCGFLAVAVPYSALLHSQTGQSPLVQGFRLHQYVVAAPADLPPDAIPQPVPLTYEDIYRGRREGRRLLPDSSEMYASLVRDNSAGAARSPFQPAEWIGNAGRNVSHLAHALGWANTALLGLALMSSFWGRRTLGERVLPVVVLTYFCMVSLVSGFVARYMEVLFPFVILLIFGESFYRGRALFRRWAYGEIVVPVMLGLGIILGLPQTALGLKLSPRFGEQGNPLAACAGYVQPRAPVFTFHPMGAYLVGGYYRVVPNDALDKVVAYGRKTGVQWLLLVDSPDSSVEYSFYPHADWIRDRAQLENHPEVRRQCSTPDGIGVLYRLSV